MQRYASLHDNVVRSLLAIVVFLLVSACGPSEEEWTDILSDQEVELVAQNQYGARALASDDDSLYWIQGWDAPMLGVMSLELAGNHTPMRLADASSTGYVSGATFEGRYYWAQYRGLHSISAAGDDESLGGAPADPSAILVEDDFIYLTASDDGDGRLGGVYRFPRQGGAEHQLSDSYNSPSGLGFDDTDLYFEGEGVLYKLAKQGGQATPLATGLLISGGIAVGAGVVYWADASSRHTSHTISSVPAGGGAPTVVIDGLEYPRRVIWEQPYVYVEVSGGGMILRLDIANHTRQVIAKFDGSSTGMALSSTHVYFATAEDGKIWRITK